MNFEEYIKFTINEFIWVLVILLYRKQKGIRMTFNQKIHFLNVLLNKVKDVQVHYQIEYGTHNIYALPFHSVITYPENTS